MAAATGAEAQQQTWIGSGPVLLHYADHIATLTLNRPDVSNGMNLDLMHALQQFAQRERLEIAHACDPETGHNCEHQPATDNKMSMLKKLVVD